MTFENVIGMSLFWAFFFTNVKLMSNESQKCTRPTYRPPTGVARPEREREREKKRKKKDKQDVVPTAVKQSSTSSVMAPPLDEESKFFENVCVRGEQCGWASS